MLLTKGKFQQYRAIFYNKLKQTPYKISLEIVTVEGPTSEGFSIEEFVGSSPRSSRFYEFQALYEREIPLRTREKYGLPKEVNGIVYLSPLQLVPVLGTFKLDWNKTKVHFAGHTQVVEKIEYLEPLYDSCVGIQIFVKDDLKA